MVNNLGFFEVTPKNPVFFHGICQSQNAKATVPSPTLPTVPAGIPAVPAVPSDLDEPLQFRGCCEKSLAKPWYHPKGYNTTIFPMMEGS